MCGITGFWDFAKRVGEPLDVLTSMTNRLKHRGPDDLGTWIDLELGIALGHRRLSIIDTSQNGHQPMLSASGRFVITLNGEIYNYLEIRKALESEGRLFRGHSDTEILLESIERYGIESTLKKLVGMFAFAVWDRKRRELFLARDRLGEKPLYYGLSKGTLLFGSELKAFQPHPHWRPKIQLSALQLFVKYNYIPAPYCIFQGIHKLTPGTYIQFSDDCRDGVPTTYWSLQEVAERGLRQPYQGNESDAIMELDASLRASVKRQMVADVPVGAFLSGGIDSSIIVSMMQSEGTQPAHTYTIGFHDDKFNEANQAKAVAEHLRTVHTELYVSPEEAQSVIPQLPELYDEPFSDSSQIPTYLVSKLARSMVTVALSGDAGDELFGGYTRYLLCESIWNQMRLYPRISRRLIATGIESVSVGCWDKIMRKLEFLLPEHLRQGLPGDKLHKLARVLRENSKENVYDLLLTHWQPESILISNFVFPSSVLSTHNEWPKYSNFAQTMMFADTASYLTDDILVKVDRAAMAVGLETRVPFLDHRIVELAFRLPLNMKIRNKKGKWIIRQILKKYVPESVFERPKMGFGVPIGTWLRGPLRDWAESLISIERLKLGGFFKPQPVREAWENHLAGRGNHHYKLWAVLMFQAWFKEYFDNKYVDHPGLSRRTVNDKEFSKVQSI